MHRNKMNNKKCSASEYYTFENSFAQHVQKRRQNRLYAVWSVSVTNRHFQVWRPQKNKWSDVMDCFMIYCGGYQRVYYKLLKFGCHGYFFKNKNEQNIQCHRVASCYSFAIHILTTWSCLVLLIVNLSQVNLAFLSDIWNFKTSSWFCKTWENFTSQIKILPKSVIVWQHPLLKMVQSKTFCGLGNPWRTKLQVTFDVFLWLCHGRTKCWPLTLCLPSTNPSIFPTLNKYSVMFSPPRVPRYFRAHWNWGDI